LAHADRQLQARDGKSHSDADANPHSYTNPHSDANPYSYSYANPHADAYTNANPGS